MALWLVIASWVAVILGLLTALAITFDVTVHPQHMKIMNVVWPITGLYLPVLGLVALCLSIGAANADVRHVANGHACCARRASVLEKRVCLDDTLRRGLRYWRHHRCADCVLGWMDALRRAALCRVFGSVCSRLYFWYRVSIPSDPLPRGGCSRRMRAHGSNQGRHGSALTGLPKLFSFRLDGRGCIFEFRCPGRSLILRHLVTYWFMNADRYGAHGFIASFPAKLASCQVGCERRHVS